MRQATVYFLRPIGMDGPIKIGFSVDPDGRLNTYMSWSPMPLEMAARLRGPRDLERRFHAAFAIHRIHHEWFEATPALTATIAAINAGAFDIATLPAPSGPRSVRDEWSAQKRTGIALKSVASRQMYEQHVGFPPEVRVAYESIKDLTGEAWESAAATLRAFARDARNLAASQAEHRPAA